MEGKIIIVDDMEVAIDLMKTILNRAGFKNISTYCCPMRALHDIEQGLSPILIISDFRMPTLNGVQFLQAVSTVHHSVPSVIITGDPDSVSETPPNCQILEKGSTNFFQSLILIVKKVCERQNISSTVLQSDLAAVPVFEKTHL
ncbi:MAG: response regulator [Fibrobacter sp.]|nr:response regulator [Fibrobacter sp.]